MIALFNTYENHGGAARSASRLFDGLASIGVPAKMYVASKQTERADVIRIPHCPAPTSSTGLISNLFCRTESARLRLSNLLPFLANDSQRYERVMSAGSTATPFRTDRGWCKVSSLRAIHITPKIWNLHWISDFLDQPEVIPWMESKAPIVWTLHDMAPFSLGWHYEPYASERTPVFKNYEKIISKRKKRLFSNISSDRLVFVSPSYWLCDKARCSPLISKFRCEVIPYGLDTEVFRPLDKIKARAEMGIPQDRIVLAFASHSTSDPRKNLKMLIEAIDSAPDHIRNKLFFITIGENQPQFSETFQSKHFGLLEHDTNIAGFYSAADVFICPSAQDNLPNTIIEAMACGTPTIGFDIGGLPDLIHSGKCGWLLKSINSESITNAIRLLTQLGSELVNEMSENCRKTAVCEYSLDSQARRYSELFNDLV